MPRAVRAPRVVVVAAVGAGELVRRVRTGRAEVVDVHAPWREVARLAWIARLAGARAVVATPTGPPGSPGPADRVVRRILVGTQDEARAWVAAGFPLGRLVVVPADDFAAEARAAVYTEVAEMAVRSGSRRREP